MQPRRLAVPALALVAIALVAGLAGYFSEGSSRASTTLEPAPAQAQAVRGVVQEVSGERLTLTTSSGSVAVRLTPATVFETYGSTTRMHISVGKDWLNVGALQHPQTLLAINGLVVISEGGPP